VTIITQNEARQYHVVSVRGRLLDLTGVEDVWYVGRSAPRAKLKGSLWKNPWKVDEFDSPEQCVAHYAAMARIVLGHCGPGTFDTRLEDNRLWYRFKDSILQSHTLIGKTLACWCCDWKYGQPEPSCHAVVLWKLANIGPHAI